MTLNLIDASLSADGQSDIQRCGDRPTPLLSVHVVKTQDSGGLRRGEDRGIYWAPNSGNIIGRNDSNDSRGLPQLSRGMLYVVVRKLAIHPAEDERTGDRRMFRGRVNQHPQLSGRKELGTACSRMHAK